MMNNSLLSLCLPKKFTHAIKVAIHLFIHNMSLYKLCCV